MINEILGKKNTKIIYKMLESKYSNNSKVLKELKDFYEYYELNKEVIKNKILSNQYEIDTVVLHEIINYKGKKRVVANLSIKDKFISKAIMRILEKYVLPTLSLKSFAYQKNKGIIDELELIRDYIQKGNKFVAKLDIKDYFDNINHDILIEKLNNYNIDSQTLDIIDKFLKCEIEYNNILSKKTKGIIQGNPLSPILANIYLDDFDKHLENKDFKFARFSDDIFLFDNDKINLTTKVNYINEILNKNYKLTINEKKIVIDKVDKVEYLGYKLVLHENNIEFIKNNRIKNKFSPYWRSNSLKYEDNEYHIINDGILTKQDYSILFENKEQKRYLPVETTNTLSIYSDVILSNNVFEYIDQKNIIINFFNKNGIYIGKFIPNSSRKSALTLLNQVKIYNDSIQRLNLAKSIIGAGIHNLISNLKYYKRRYNIEIDEKITKIEKLYNEIKQINEYNSLLLTEARIREIYYSSFNYILKNKDFYFYKRTKRPPQDCINCLISFGNTLLYNFIAREIYKTTLDIRIGYLHATNNRYESLNLDISEIFKPIIIDKIIFTLVNKKMISAVIHFEKVKNGIYLNSEGKRIFVREFYDELREQMAYKNKTVSYEGIIRKEIYKLINFINNNEKYKPYKYY